MDKWKVDENKELSVAVIEDTEDGFGICELSGGGTTSREELEKIAHLIAAAPELLKAGKIALEYLRANPDEYSNLRAEELEQAIKKAETV